VDQKEETEEAIEKPKEIEEKEKEEVVA